MKTSIKHLAIALAATLQLAALAAVPLAWDVRPGQPAPVMFDRYHGESLEFRCTFRAFGELPFAVGADIRLWYQTNGMGQAWWSAPATLQSNVLSAVWSPDMDPGAERVSLFFGAPSNAYAAAVLRLRHSPGFAPGEMPDTIHFEERDPQFAAWLESFSLMSATNYTDAAARAATNYTDSVASGLAPLIHGHAQITDGTNTVTAAREVYERVATGFTAWAPTIQEVAQGEYVYRDVYYAAPKYFGSEDELLADGYYHQYSNWQGPGWYYMFDVYQDGEQITTAGDYCSGPSNALELASSYFGYVRSRTYELVAKGRLALTNDVPEWPAEMVHTNTPLIFADGEDTNVTSLALHAQPENYTSLSFLAPVSYYLPNRFSLLELGHDYQIAAAQWFQVGRYLYLQNPENIVFVGGGQHRSFQDYLDACSPQTMADLLSCYVPTNGGGRIHGDLTIDGRLTAGELVTITNSDIHAKGFQVVNKVLTADGIMASNGMVRLNCARFALGFGTPRIHLETNDLSAITYGGTWENPAGSVFSWQDEHIAEYLAGNAWQQDIELRNPYVRYMDVQNDFVGWKIKDHNVNNGPLKHFTLDNYRTHHFTDADVGNYGIEFTIASNAHARIVYDFASAPPSAVYFFCARDGNDQSAMMLSNGTELLAPTAGATTLLEIEHLSGWTYIVKETPLTYENTVMPWVQAQEEEP